MPTSISRAVSALLKKASDYLPYCKDMGIPYLVGTSQPSLGMQVGSYTMAGGGVVSFAALGLQPMADGNYQVVFSKQSGTTQPLCAAGTRTVSQFVITGPTNGEVCDFIVVGKISGMA